MGEKNNKKLFYTGKLYGLTGMTVCVHVHMCVCVCVRVHMHA